MKRFIMLLVLSAALSQAAPVSLFNGIDLTGWKGDGYYVDGGELICTTKGRLLVSDKEYADYELEFDFKLPPAGNHGLGIHYLGGGDPSQTGMEVQILDDGAVMYQKLKDYQFHGSLYLLKAAKRGQLNPIGQWNHQKVTVLGDQVTVELNGVVITEANLADLSRLYPSHQGVKRRSGRICLCGHGDRVSFRNFMINEIEPPQNPMPWKINLWTEHEHEDFMLYCEWRWMGPKLFIKQHGKLPMNP